MCDTLAVVGESGLLFAKSSDRPPTEPQVFEAFPARPGGGRLRTQYLEIEDAGAVAFVGSRPTWLWGVEHGVNEHGVAIGNERLYTRGVRGRPRALLGMDLVRLGLERGRTAEEAVEAITTLVEAHGQGGSGEPDADTPYDSSFLVADAASVWVVETDDRTWVAKAYPEGAAISNRITLGADWDRASADVPAGADFDAHRHPRVPTGLADHRLRATRACVARGRDALDPLRVAAVLRDHGSGPWGGPGADRPVVPPPADLGPDLAGVTVCMHVPGVQATTASMIATVTGAGSVRAWVACGSPCVTPFRGFDPGDGVPAALSDVATWHRHAADRDRVDRDPGTLAAIRAEVDGIEAAELAPAGGIAGGRS